MPHVSTPSLRLAGIVIGGAIGVLTLLVRDNLVETVNGVNFVNGNVVLGVSLFSAASRPALRQMKRDENWGIAPSALYCDGLRST